jgi:endonuclease I
LPETVAPHLRIVLEKITGLLIEAWNRQYPPDAWECERARLIIKIIDLSNV